MIYLVIENGFDSSIVCAVEVPSGTHRIRANQMISEYLMREFDTDIENIYESYQYIQLRAEELENVINLKEEHKDDQIK